MDTNESRQQQQIAYEAYEFEHQQLADEIQILEVAIRRSYLPVEPRAERIMDEIKAISTEKIEIQLKDISIVQSRKALRKYIKRFGKRIVFSMCIVGLIRFNDTDEYLKKKGFKRKIWSAARSNIRRGKMPMHLCKTTGQVKQAYIGHSMATYVNSVKKDQLPKNKAILNRLYDRFYQVYAAKYKKKFDGIDLEIDPITCDTIHNPVYIKTDWDKNCKIVYSLATILQLSAIKYEPIGVDIDAAGVEEVYFKHSHENHYISPYTKSTFNLSDIKHVKLNLLKN